MSGKVTARQKRALEWAELSDASRDRVAAVILTGLSPCEAERAIARISAECRAAADEMVRRYHADTADRMERLLRRALAARGEAHRGRGDQSGLAAPTEVGGGHILVR